MKKGFTILEILITIIIIAVVTTIGITAYNSIGHRSKQRMYETKVKLIETNSEKWADEKGLKQPTTITVNKLILEGYLEADKNVEVTAEQEYDLIVIDPRDNKTILNCNLIHISFDKSNVIAKYQDERNCGLIEQEISDGKISFFGEEIAKQSEKLFPNGLTPDADGNLPWTRHDVRLTMSTEYENVTKIEWYQNGNKLNEKGKSIDIKPSLLLESKFIVSITTEEGIKTKGVTVRIDKEKPEQPSIENPANNDWTNKDIQLTLKSRDLGSGINRYEWSYDGINWTSYAGLKSSTVTPPKYVTEMNEKIYIRVVDNVGNISNISTTDLKIDKTAPTCTLTKENDEWMVNPPGKKVEFNSQDNLPATIHPNDRELSNAVSGIDESKTHNGFSSPSKANVTVNVTAGGTYKATVVDKAGNQGTCSIVIEQKYQYRSDVCSVGKRCSGAGCETWRYCANSACGVAAYNYCAHPECGIAAYNYCAAAACGVAQWRYCAAAACGGIYGYVQTGRTCYYDLTRDPSNGTTIRNCSYPGGGGYCCDTYSYQILAYNQCRTSACGAESYNSCRTAACGVQSYNSCRTPGCGVESYNSCRTSGCGCETWLRNAMTCGCETWKGAWSAWTDTKITATNALRVETRILVK